MAFHEQANEFSELRNKFGITNAQLAEEMGLSPITVGQWSCGSRQTDMRRVRAAVKKIVVRRYKEVQDEAD